MDVLERTPSVAAQKLRYSRAEFLLWDGYELFFVEKALHCSSLQYRYYIVSFPLIDAEFKVEETVYNFGFKLLIS